MTKRLGEFKALTFDCYGTLIDWESGIWNALRPLLQANGCDALSRARALESFAESESRQQAETPEMLYGVLLSRVHRAVAERHGLASSPELDAAFAGSIADWPAFPDTAAALRRLKRRFKLVILSNVDRDGFQASRTKLGVDFDAVYTAEDIGSYKPAAANFTYMLERVSADFGLGAEDILHTAQSLFHDHVPASRFGLASAWIDRQGLAKGGHWGATVRVPDRPEADFIFATLADMAEAVFA
ncbi:MAG TPA: haloacid dehalogenase type II [Rhodospirillales bacterium]|nr:haloacid dehalogenase type II [Rhodospirillales bacterium]HJO68536.1 haloacid dehalogenase type II [Rhodospirillales bacterium]